MSFRRGTACPEFISGRRNLFEQTKRTMRCGPPLSDFSDFGYTMLVVVTTFSILVPAFKGISILPYHVFNGYHYIFITERWVNSYGEKKRRVAFCTCITRFPAF